MGNYSPTALESDRLMRDPKPLTHYTDTLSQGIGTPYFPANTISNITQ